VEIRAEQHEDLALAQDARHAVALDLTLNDDLVAEGIARELIRHVNDRRKARGFELADRVSATVRTTGRPLAAAQRHAEWIAGEVLAKSFDLIDDPAAGGNDAATIDGTSVVVDLERIASG
jgi:isoleucyl-tRNA synthetase